MSTVLEFVLKLADQKSDNKEMNAYHILYAYTQLLTMNEKVLEGMFSSEQDKKELNEVRNIVRVRDLDIDIMKKGLFLILAGNLKETEASSAIDSEKWNELQKKRADELLQDILNIKDIHADCFKTGCTLEDMLRLKKELTRKEEKKDDAPAFETSEPETDEKAVSPDQGDQKPASSPGKTEDEPAMTEGQNLESLALHSKDLYYNLKQTVIGQDDAIDMFVRGYFESELFSGIKRSDSRPSATFLFAGPPGVGKTLLATEAARALGRPCLRLNMSEYSDHQSGSELIGIPRHYSGASKGKLLSFVETSPRAVVIFDEIEKAHLNVVQLFLQILDGGILQDVYDSKNVSFKDTILIFTTNAGKALYEDKRRQNLSHLDSVTILDALQKEEHPYLVGPLFPAAICSRFTAGNVIMFNHLNARYLRQIVQMNFDKCIGMLAEKFSWKVEYDEKLLSLFLFHQSVRMDARIISARSSHFFQEEIYEYARQAVLNLPLDSLERFRFSMNMENANPEVLKLFADCEQPEIVLIGEEDPDKKGYIPISEDIIVHRVSDIKQMAQILAEKDVSFVVVDPDYGIEPGKDYGFSLDDIRSAGMLAFHALRVQMPEIRIYILDKDSRLRDADRVTFLRQGAEGFIQASGSDEKIFHSEIRKIAADDYLQDRVNELAGRGRHLAFNTAQKVSPDKTEAFIEFYDFKIYTAVEAEDQKLVLNAVDRPKTGFSDVIGAENAVEELRYFVRFLKEPKRFILNGTKPPKGILLYGPPGTGKTMLARAMAGEADATFFAANATDFMNKYVGEGEKQIRQLFTAARKYAPSIIFIDEIDAVAKERTGESHIETYLNTLMTEMDGFQFDVKKPVFVLAATNFALDRSKANGRAVIDPALLRRFDNKIQVDLPNKEERLTFLRRQISKINNQQVADETLKNIADRTTGESLANLQNIINLAVRTAGRHGQPLSDSLLLESMEEFFYGEKHEWDADYYKKVAHHEAGHAYIAYLSGRAPSFVTIISRGDFGGYMQHESDEEVPSYTKEQLLWRIRCALAGRASERVFFGEEAGTNTGVSGDLQTATNLALSMICRYGMAEETMLSLDMSQVMDTAIGETILQKAGTILQEEMQYTTELIRQGKEKVENLSQKLLEKNQLIGEEIRVVLSA